MTLLRTVLLLICLATMATLGGEFRLGQSSAQASTPMDETMPAKDAATSRADIRLTNSCIDAGLGKEHCICVTKVFKHELSLREYMAAISLYESGQNKDITASSAAKISLRQRGYKDPEINMIDGLQRRLSKASNVENMCPIASAYFDAPAP